MRFVTVNEGTFDPAEAGTWLHCVPDGDPSGTGLPVMLSAEYNRDVYVARADPLDTGIFATGALSWTLLGTENSGDVSDHWHVVSGGKHYVSTSDRATANLYACAFEPDLSDAGSPPTSGSTPIFSTSSGSSTDADYATNDHFMYPTRTGVAIGVWKSSTPCLVVGFVESDLTLYSTAEVGDSALVLANGSSVTRMAGSGSAALAFLCPSNMSPYSGGSVMRYVEANLSLAVWAEETTREIEFTSDDHLAMATMVRFPNGYTAVTYRRLEPGLVSTRGGPDYGDIVRDVYDDTGALQSRDALIKYSDTRAANRPHTALYTSSRGAMFLVTCWDEYDTLNSAGLGCTMLVERVFLV